MVKRLLMFEDDEGVALLLMDLVNVHGWDACLRNCFDASDPLLEWADVVLVDVDFAQQSGDVVISELRAAGRHMPVVVLGDASALPQEVNGPDPRIYVTQPLAVPELLSALDLANNWVVDITDDAMGKIIDITTPKSVPAPKTFTRRATG